MEITDLKILKCTPRKVKIKTRGLRLPIGSDDNLKFG